MSQNTSGAPGPEAEGAKKPANQTDESAGGAIKKPQQSGNDTRERWDTSRGSEPANRGTAGRR